MNPEEVDAIETLWEGIWYRSRTEARWAIYFDQVLLHVEHEPIGYRRRSDGRCYLPDFWIPRWNCWAEVKRKTFSQEEFLLASSLPEPCLLLAGTPAYYYYYAAESCLGNRFYDLEQAYKDYLQQSPKHLVDLGLSVKSNRLRYVAVSHEPACQDQFVVDALVAARAARFEYGEKGPPRKLPFGVNVEPRG